MPESKPVVIQAYDLVEAELPLRHDVELVEHSFPIDVERRRLLDKTLLDMLRDGYKVSEVLKHIWGDNKLLTFVERVYMTYRLGFFVALLGGAVPAGVGRLLED
jgi:hypothetical protein